MKTFIDLIKLILWLLPLYYFFIGIEDLNKLMKDGVYLFIYFIIYTCFTIRDINERCYRIEKKVMAFIDIEEDKIINEKFDKVKKYNEEWDGKIFTNNFIVTN